MREDNAAVSLLGSGSAKRLHDVFVGQPVKPVADHPVSTAPPRLSDHRGAILPAIHAFDLPDIRLDACLLKFMQGLYGERRTQFPIVSALVSSEPLQLCGFHGNQQLKEKQAVAAVQIVGEPL
jgi:hypothetical protein